MFLLFFSPFFSPSSLLRKTLRMKETDFCEKTMDSSKVRKTPHGLQTINEWSLGNSRSGYWILDFVLHFKLDIIVDEMVHGLAFVGLEDQLSLLDDVPNDNNEFLV